jgi:hypothetical protein
VNQRNAMMFFVFGCALCFVHPFLGLFIMAIALSVAVSGTRRRSPAHVRQEHAPKGHARIAGYLTEIAALNQIVQDGSRTYFARCDALNRMVQLGDQYLAEARAAGGYDMATVKSGVAKLKLAYKQMTEAAMYELPDDLEQYAPTEAELADVRAEGFVMRWPRNLWFAVALGFAAWHWLGPHTHGRPAAQAGWQPAQAASVQQAPIQRPGGCERASGQPERSRSATAAA